MMRDLAWWDPEQEGNRARALFGLVDRILEQQPLQRQIDLHHMRVYTARDINSLAPGEYERGVGVYDPSTLNFNVVAQVCDTLVSKIAKSRPLPQFQTSGGSYFQRKRAKQLGKFIEGIFYDTRQFSISPQIVRDAAVFGTGFLKIYRSGDRIFHERVFPWEIIVEASEGQHGDPPSIYQRVWVDRRRLAAKFPESRPAIMAASVTKHDTDDTGYDPLSDQLRVIEAWHLRSGPEEDDGMHVVAIGDEVLFEEQYERDVFPFVYLHAKDPVMSFRGIGKAEELTGLQFEISAISAKIQESYFRTGSYWILQANAGIVDTHIDNNIGTIIKVNGAAPQKYDPVGVSQDTFNYLAYLVPKANEMSGVSALSAQSLKPAGLNSGKAIDAYNDVETERFVLFGKAYEDMHMQIAKHDIAMAREIAAEYPEYSVRAPGRMNFGRVPWKDVNLDDDDFVMQVTPVAMLSKTYSERIQQVTDLRGQGYITGAQAKMLLDFPDIESWTEIDQAPQRLVQKWLEEMVEKGRARSPEPMLDLEFSIGYSTRFYCHLLESDDVDEDRLQMVRDWIADCKELMGSAQQSPPAGQAPPAAPPTAGPGVMAQ